MTTAVRQSLIVAIALTALISFNLVQAGFVSIVDSDNAGEDTRFDASTNTVISTAKDGDLDVCRTFAHGKTEITLPKPSSEFTQARLIVRAFDVDENAQPAQGYPFPEQDNVIFNNTTLGYLSGEYQVWSSSIFPLAAETIHAQNLLQIDIDIRGQQQTPPNPFWCVVVDWGQLVFDSGVGTHARIKAFDLSSTLKAGDDISLQMTVQVETPQAGDYLLELSILNPEGHVISTHDSGEQLYNRSAAQLTDLSFIAGYSAMLASGEYSLTAVVYDITATQNNVWPNRVQDIQQRYFTHTVNTQPAATLLQDQDGDTLLDHWESTSDSDGDGIADFLDADDDGDGVSTRYEHQTLYNLIALADLPNTDGDALPNYLDLDDDDDGRPTAQEGAFADSDLDGVLDFLDAADQNPCYPKASHGLCDVDGDGELNQVDGDIDGDGIANDIDPDSYPPVAADLVVPVNENTRSVLNLNAVDQDDDGDALQYALLPDQDAAYFSLDANTGELQFLTAPDYEQHSTPFHITYQVSAAGKQAQATIQILVRNIDDEPLSELSDTDATPNFIYDNARRGTSTGIQAFAEDADGDAVSYELLNTQGDLFVVDSATGVIRLNKSGALNADEQATYELTVIAKSTVLSGEQQKTFTLTVIKYEDQDQDGVPDDQDPDITDPCNPNQNTPGCNDSGTSTGGKDTTAEGRLETGKGGIGALAVSWWLFILAIVSLQPKIIRRSVWLLLGVIASVSVSATPLENTYIGFGQGSSQLNPDTSGTTYQVESDTATSWKVLAGWQWSEQWALEGFYSQLGEAKFETGGALSYTGKGGALVFNHWLNGTNKRTGSVALSAKAGMNSLTNDGRSVRYEKTSVLQPLIGLGAQVALPWSLSLKGELEWYGSDASVFSINIVKYFGQSQRTSKPKPTPSWDDWLVQETQRETQLAQAEEAANEAQFEFLMSEQQAIAMIQALPPTAAIRERKIQVQPQVRDVDLDGVLDDEDQCKDTPRTLPANEKGCAVVQGRLPALTFESSNEQLTLDAKQVLKPVIEALLIAPDVKVEIQAHTDNQGEEQENLALSTKQARAVAAAFIEAGIEKNRLIVRGYGELMPIASNLTKDGRAQNQRIELKVLVNNQ